MKESIFNYHFLINDKEYLFNTNNGGLIELIPMVLLMKKKDFR